ncbi:MAG: response regulator [Elusimicrobiota bacterium]|jgi:DNA-binding response OmpR family regulator
MGQAPETSHIEQTVVSNLKESQPDQANRLRILVVDDDPVVRRIILELLNTRYSVISASTGVQLPVLLQKHRPNLVILDVMLPWVNGFELCRIIKTNTQGQNLPVLFLTGCKEKEDLMTGKEVGASGYLTKPFYARDLYREVERLLAA